MDRRKTQRTGRQMNREDELTRGFREALNQRAGSSGRTTGRTTQTGRTAGTGRTASAGRTRSADRTRSTDMTGMAGNAGRMGNTGRSAGDGWNNTAARGSTYGRPGRTSDALESRNADRMDRERGGSILDEQEVRRIREQKGKKKIKAKHTRKMIRRVNLFFALLLLATVALYKIAVPAMGTSGKSEKVEDQVIDTGINYTDNNPSQFLTQVSGEQVPVLDYLDKFSKVSNRGLTVKKDANGIYTMTNTTNSSFNVLQLTDLHIGGTQDYYDADIKAINAVYNLVNRTHPDFIVLTGDIVFGMPYKSDADSKSSLEIVLKLMDQIGIPWTWTFGNHDHNFFDRYSSDEIKTMISASKTLYMYPDNPNIKGYSNGTFRLCNKDGSLNTALIMLDSNESLYKSSSDTEPYDYSYIHQNQVEWYQEQIQALEAQEGKSIKSMVFFHIPLQEYNTAWDLYEQNDSSVTYLFGAKRETIDASSYDSNIFKKAVELGSTEAMFCGHDHVNDFGIKYQGIDLVFGKSIDYAAYTGIAEKTEQRGAILIRIGQDSSYHINSIRLAQ